MISKLKAFNFKERGSRNLPLLFKRGELGKVSALFYQLLNRMLLVVTLGGIDIDWDTGTTMMDHCFEIQMF